MKTSGKLRPALLSTPLLPTPNMPLQVNSLFDTNQSQYANQMLNTFNNRRPNNNSNNNKIKKGITNKTIPKRPKFNNNNKANKNNIKINKNTGQFYSLSQNASKKGATSNGPAPEIAIIPSNLPSPNSLKIQEKVDQESKEHEKLASFLSNAGDIDERFIDKTTARLDVDYRLTNSNDNLATQNKR
jgi:hypothetical protein